MSQAKSLTTLIRSGGSENYELANFDAQQARDTSLLLRGHLLIFVSRTDLILHSK